MSTGKNAVETAQKFKVNASTVKAIYKKFCSDGTYFETKDEKKVREITEEF